MNYLNIEEIKKQCRIEDWFTEDDEMLESIGDGAENYLENYLDQALDDITAENGGTLPPALHRALLILVSYLYDNDGSGQNQDVPQAFFVLTLPFKNYSIV